MGIARARCGRRRCPCAPVNGWRQGGVLGQDRRLDAAQLGARLEPELLTQDSSALLVRAQGLGLAAAAVEGGHQEAAQALPERVGGHQCLELGDRRLVAPDLELEIEPFLDGAEAQLGQAADHGSRELVVREVGERVAAPQRLRLDQQGDRSVGVAGERGRPAVGDELLEPRHIDRTRRELEHVPAPAHGDELPGPQRSPQLGDQPLQAVAHARRRVLAPQRVDQLVGRHDPTHAQRQHRQESCAAWRR